MPFDKDLLDAVIDHSDIVSVVSSYIPVIKKGRGYVSVCPFHDDHNPSMTISPERKTFMCWVCHSGGSAVTFVQKYEKISFGEALRKVAEISNYQDPRLLTAVKTRHIDENLVPLYKAIDDLQKYYIYGLSVPEAEKARTYLDKRNLDEETRKRHEIGYSLSDGAATIKYLQAKGHSLKSIEDIGIALARAEGTSDHNAGRLIFPLFDPNGQVVGFSARQLEKDGTAKYINSPEGPLFHKGRLLYNYHLAKVNARHENYCYLLEGFMDVYALEKAGLPNAVALCGTALTNEQIELLRRLNCEIRLCLDGDGPGQTAMMKCIGMLQKAHIPFRLVSNPGDLRDPDDILQEEGPEKLKEMMLHLVDPYDFQIDYYNSTKKLETAEDKKKVLTYFLPFLANVPAGIERENYIVKLSKATGYEADAIRKLVPHTQNRPEDGQIALDDDVVEQNHVMLKQKAKTSQGPLDGLERCVLHYMLRYPEAIDYFQNNIKNFCIGNHQDIAEAILDYVHGGDKTIEISKLITMVEGSDIGNAEELTRDIAEIDAYKNFPPYGPEAMQRISKRIEEKRSELFDDYTFSQALNGKTKEEKARIMSDNAKLRTRKKQKAKEQSKEE